MEFKCVTGSRMKSFFMMFLVFLGMRSMRSMSNEQGLWCISTWCENVKWKIWAEISLYLEAFLGKGQWINNLGIIQGNFGKLFLKNTIFFNIKMLIFKPQNQEFYEN